MKKVGLLNSVLVLIALCLTFNLKAQQLPNVDFIKALLYSHPEQFQTLLSSPEQYKIQIFYTRIDRDSSNKIKLTTYSFQPDQYYYYPASLVKLPASLMSLEKINQLAIEGLSEYNQMWFDTTCSCSRIQKKGSNGLYPAMADHLKRILLTSDNESYNHLYDWLGSEYLTDTLRRKGYKSAFIISRYDPECGGNEQLCTNGVVFTDSTGRRIFQSPAHVGVKTYAHPKGTVRVGYAYLNAANKKVYQPKDFSRTNFITLEQMHQILIGMVLPETVPAAGRFRITEQQRSFLMHYMGMYPRESDIQEYQNPKIYFDGFKKYLLYGGQKNIPTQDSIRIYNIVGQAYGFSSDVAYIVDYKNKVEFFLSATIYTNQDGIINDGRYEYNSVAMPFFKNIGTLIYQYELMRKRNSSIPLKFY